MRGLRFGSAQSRPVSMHVTRLQSLFSPHSKDWLPVSCLQSLFSPHSKDWSLCHHVQSLHTGHHKDCPATVPALDFLIYIRVRCRSARFECDDAVYDLNEISYNAPAEGERPPDFNMKAECLDQLHFAIIYDYAVYQRFSIPRSKKC